ncbi:Protein of uncharacterised function (DUF1488) [Klebsiella pneumoniae]|uniref:Protein of uncharacterized function (DUF1488) n=2 Tax=Klebsiella pneumoniae TaxID=573 RepID=A0A377YQA4_KLEPN|nr:Protein of uncharacterised function (DUF1488) [Klebsiella pneumoniae]
MNQAIQFPDRESWDAERQGVVFPALVNGMQLTCAISGQILQQRFGAEGPAQWLAAFQEHRWDLEKRQSIDPRWSGRCSGLDLVILIQVLIFPFHIVIC